MNTNEKQPKAAICANCIYKTISGGGTDKFYKCKDSCFFDSVAILQHFFVFLQSKLRIELEFKIISHKQWQKN